jgi:hypothetical protein
MLKTIEWSGIPVITGSLTDFLLCVEDYLDDSEPLFVRLGGVWDILPRLTADFSKKQEDVMVLSDGLTAGCLALKTNASVFSTAPAAFIQVLLNLALETNKHVLLITDEPKRYREEISLEEFQRTSRLSIISNEEVDKQDLMGWIVKRGTTIFVYDAPNTQSFVMFEELVADSMKGFLWVQMPSLYHTVSHPAIRPKKLFKPHCETWSLLKAKAYIFSNVFKTNRRLSLGSR